MQGGGELFGWPDEWGEEFAMNLGSGYKVKCIAAREGVQMPLKLKWTVKQMLAEANAEIETISAEDAIKLKDDPGIVFVDIRDIRELTRDGRIPGAVHAPRGMLEFWVDPESPYHRRIFASGKRFLFF